ncbi:uncharacterized protein LOC126772548, partial [Nymphalis io]|uniref:uncharacterized protein LOC126772548 n=1 Tax=Inachis io TaxID=171585 RepID=UPI002169EF0A
MEKVLTSTHCFLTNRKRRKRNFNRIRIGAGILDTLVRKSVFDNKQQWRKIDHLYTQRFYRFPAYNLAVVKVDNHWDFNEFVNKIPYTKWNQDFDGVCVGTGVRTTKSWSKNKHLFAVTFHLVTRRNCEQNLLRSCLLYYCTEYDIKTLSSTEIEGGGLVCVDTGDPAEEMKSGVLIGVTSVINVGLPSLHNRVGLYYKWVTDASTQCHENV